MHGVVHVEIPVTNLKRAKDWYGRVFGWTFQDFDKEYALWNPTDGGTGGGLYLTKKIPARAVARVYVEVEDVDATLQHIKKARGTILKERTEVPSFGWWASFREPQGAELYLWQSARRA